MIKVRISKKVINKAYLEFFNQFDKKVEVLKGGGSAGKSFAIAQRLIYRMLAYQGYNSMIIRAHQNTNRTSTIPMMKQIISAWNLEGLFKINDSIGNEKIINTFNGNECIFKGLDDISKLKSIVFPTGPLIYVWIEEADECELEDCLQIEKVRLRGKAKFKKQVTYSFNPISVNHWLKKRFFDKEEKDCYILETTYKDNKFLTEDDINGLESLKEIDELQYMVYVLNQWGIRSDTRVFNNVVVHEFDCPIRYYEDGNVRDYTETIYQGQDFGFNDPNAFVQCFVRDQELYVFNEIVKYNQNINEFIYHLEQILPIRDININCDSANPGDIDILQQSGFKVSSSQKGKMSVYDSIMYLKSFKKIHIHSVNCPVAAVEFQEYQWRKVKKDGQMVILDEPVDSKNHTIDAVRYATEDLRLDRQVLISDESIGGYGL